LPKFEKFPALIWLGVADLSRERAPTGFLLVLPGLQIRFSAKTLEEAAIREISEEAGIEVKNLRYMRSQPWPFPDSLMIGFIAEWASGEARPDRNEIDHIAWYGADDLPELPLRGSIARYLIDSFIAGGFSNG